MEINNEVEEQRLMKLREDFESAINTTGNVWGHSAKGLEGKRAAMAMLSTKTGLYARIPIVCKGDTCPYSESCPLLKYSLAPEGEVCAVETAMIEVKYAGYMIDYDLENASLTDISIVTELINTEIMLERSKALLAKEQVPIEQVFAGSTEDGDAFSKPEISKALESYERNWRLKEKMLDLLDGTRKAKNRRQQSDTNAMLQLLETNLSQDFIIEEKPEDNRHE